MDQSQVEYKLDKNTEDINSLAVNMATLTEIVKNSEKRHEEAMDGVKEAVQGIQKLHEKVASMVILEKEVSTLKESISELKADQRVLKHDLSNTTTTTNGLAENFKTVITDVSVLKSWKDQTTGAVAATGALGKFFWTLFGGTITTGIGVIIYLIVLYKQGGLDAIN